jgi:hypothetical protein
MLPNKFDQYFRDKLLDHSTKPAAGAWKMIQTGLLRHKAFHFWKWWVAGPSVVVVAVTGFVILTQINKPGTTRPRASTHAFTQAPVPPTRSVVSSNATTTDTTIDNTPGTGRIEATSSTPNSSKKPATTISAATTATAVTVHKAHTITGTNSRLDANTLSNGEAYARHSTNGHPTNGQSEGSHPTNGHPGTGIRKTHHGHPHSEPGVLASATAATENADLSQNQNTAVPPASTKLPAPKDFIAKLKIVHPSTRMAVTAKTPNPGSSRNLIVPAAHSYHHKISWRFDGFASPEYFTFKGFGFSYGAGARATLILKDHFTITTGLQYLKVDVTARSTYDSLNQLFPGIFNNIQLPVFFGYTTGNDRFSFTANAGMILSVYSDAKGRLKDEGWPNRNGPSAYIGFNFATRVSDRLSIFAEPYFKCWYPQRSQDLPARLYSTGISLGLRLNIR